jgi:hypothetical protein
VVDLVPGASVAVFATALMNDETIPLYQLPSYLSRVPESGIFAIEGTRAAATAISEQYTP